MTSTTTAFLAVTQNLSRYQAMTAAEPAVKTATAYYEANIGSVSSAQDLVGNYRLLSYALNAYGLGDQINNKGLITKVLEGGVSNSKSLANTLPDSRWKAFAAAFNFIDSGATSPSSSSAVRTTTSDYVEQQLESDQGGQDVGVQLALYFQRVAPTVTSEYGILADTNLLQVAATIMGLSPSAAADLQPQTLSELMPLSDLQDPGQAQAADRAVHRDVRLYLWAGLRRDHEPQRRFRQFEFRAIGRGRGPLQHHQFERLAAGRRAQQLHRRDAGDVLDLSDGEHVEADAGRVDGARRRLISLRKARASAVF
jgi:Protein of unknown function (DUF1217)